MSYMKTEGTDHFDDNLAKEIIKIIPNADVKYNKKLDTYGNWILCDILVKDSKINNFISFDPSYYLEDATATPNEIAKLITDDYEGSVNDKKFCK